MTSFGYKKLQKELKKLINQDRPNIIAAIADPLNKLISTRYYYGVQYRDCFVGSAALNFLVKNNVVQSKKEGMSVLNTMLKDDQLIKHVTNEQEFKDEYLFYVFADVKKSRI